MPIDGASGAAEAIAPLVKFPILMRIALPGAIGVAWLYPLIDTVLSDSLLRGWKLIVLLFGLIVTVGVAASAVRSATYRVYQGRLLWPKWLFSKRLARHQKRIEELLAEADACHLADPVRYDEIWYQLRAYPLAMSGIPYALRPTMLGNILASYEKYPLTRYGMDS